MTESIDKRIDFSTLFRNSPHPVCILDNAEILLVNHAFKELTGYDDDEVDRNPLFKFIHGDDAEAIDAALNSMNDNAIQCCFKTRFLTKNGTFLRTEWAVFLDVNTGLKYCTARNIDHIGLENKIAGGNIDLIYAVFDQASIGVCIADVDGGIKELNRKFTEIWGLSENNEETFKLQDLTHPGNTIDGAALFKRILDGDIDHYALERKYVAKSGREFWAGVSISLIKDSYGDPAYLLALVQDISERKLTEEALRSEASARIQAEEMNHLKDEFLSLMDHELRTPLNSINGFAQTMLRALNKGTLTGKKHEIYIKYILESGNLLNSIIDDIMEIAKIEADRLPIYFESIDAEDILRSIDTSYYTRAKEKGLLIEKESASGLPACRGDFKRVVQVMHYLLDNALKFTFEGSIRFGAFAAEKSNKTVVFFVEDTGIGLEDSQRETIFEKFTKIDSSGSIPGAGLGLSIARKLVEMMNGRIWIESRPNAGTKIFFQLEISPDRPA